ncbi:MAG: AtpZ/AtpI family protein [Rickettsiales bacterium]|jgi:ATP synthase protein I|nr:AtpZ/AtpI family protein [Rickettsiales bacterium]
MTDSKEPLPSLDQLQKKIDQHAASQEKPDNETDARAAATAMRLGTELMAGALVGCFIGFWIDKAAGTSPIFLVVFTLLGFAAGVRNIIRSMDKV